MTKQIKKYFQPKHVISTPRPFPLLHMNLLGPTKTTSLGGKRYSFVIVNVYSHFTWIISF